jgi:hypothetical protein
MTRNLLLLALLLLGPVQLRAQNTQANRIPAFCPRVGESVAQGGTRAAMDSALQKLHFCGADARAEALVRGLRRLRTSRDSAAVGRMWRETNWLLDGRIFTAALSIASDDRASVISRLYAFRHLLQIGRPRWEVDIEELARTHPVVGKRRRGCTIRQRGFGFPHEGAPVPVSAPRTIRSTAQHVIAAASPQEIQSAAQCILDVVGG